MSAKVQLEATGRTWVPGVDKPELPHLFTARHYQREVFEAWEKGYRRFITVWPRGSGKDNFWANFIACRMAEEKGIYKHVFPEKLMGRNNWWNEYNNKGFRFLDHFPRALCLNDGRRGRNEQEMSVTYVNGSVYQVIGADEPDRLRGGNPAGVVFSEYAWCSRLAWPIVEPRILARPGWAGFNSTPDGRDESLFSLIKAVAPHLLERFMAAAGDGSRAAAEDLLDDPEWFVSIQTNNSIKKDGAIWEYDATLGEEGGYREFIEAPVPGPIYSDADLVRMRKQGRSEAWIAQEVYCSFTGEREGAYYGPWMVRARNEKRIGAGCATWDPRYMVSTAWDVGHTDHTSIWFFQRWGSRVNLIDFHQESGKDITHYVKVLRERPYRYNSHWGPHDIKQHHFSAQKSAFEIAREAGIYFNLVPEVSFVDGVNAARMVLPRCCFESPACDVGIESLERYRAIFNKKLNEQGTHPVHDRHSHGADAFRYLALVVDQEQDSQMQRTATSAEGDFDVFSS
jgi:phage terminase large subunit